MPWRKGRYPGPGLSPAASRRSVTEGVPTGGRVPNGALVEREVAGSLDNSSATRRSSCSTPISATATQVADVDQRLCASGGSVTPVAHERDMRSVALSKPKEISATRFLAEIGDLLVYPDVPARVVINERTGTVVIGQDVQISTVAMTHGTLTVRVTETPVASQPEPFSKTGKTVVLPRTDVDGHRAGRAHRVCRRRQPQVAGRRPQPHRPEADRHHRHPAGDQDRRRPAGGARGPVAG